MGRRKTHEEYVEELRKRRGGEYEVLGVYTGSITKTKHKHVKCGYVWEVRPNSILSGHGCLNCSSNSLKTNEDYKKELLEKTKGEYEVLGVYTGSITKTKHRHIKCGHVWGVRPTHILRGYGCPNCFGKSLKTNEDYKKELLEKTKGEYEVLGVYTNIRTKTKHKHVKCGSVWNVRPNDILNGSGCPSCSSNSLKTNENYKNELLEKTKGEYEVLGVYTGNMTKTKHKHGKCGYVWEVKPSSILSGKGCPVCNQSKGELRVGRFLEDNNIKHIKEHRDKACRNKHPLPFDFAILHGNKTVYIEYDGEQHFRPVIGWGGDAALKRTQRNDAIKTKYCADNGIPLIRIKYTEFDDIERILTEKLTEYGVLPLESDSSAIGKRANTESA